MSQRGCMSSGNKVQKQKKDAWSLGKGKQEKCIWEEEDEAGKGTAKLPRERACLASLNKTSFV